MTAVFERALTRPSTVSGLESAVARLAKAQGVAPNRLRLAVSFTIIAAVLERVRDYDGTAGFVIKGGVAIERRIPAQARATRDLDAIFKRDLGDLVGTLEHAFKEPFEGFTLRRHGEPESVGPAVRVMVRLSYEGSEWATVPLEVSRREGRLVMADSVRALDLTPLGLRGPSTLPCLPIRRQVAQKIHALTEPPREPGKENTRVKDLFDLLALRETTPLDPELRAECKQVFRSRGTHSWPPTIVVASRWHDEYRRIAGEQRALVTDVTVAAQELATFIAQIEGLAHDTFATEFSQIVPTLRENSDLRVSVITLIELEPMPGKVLEGRDRLLRFRDIMALLVVGEIGITEAIQRTQAALPRDESVYKGDNRVFAHGWAERLVRTQFSRFYNQAVLEELRARSEARCYVPHSSEEDPASPCSMNLAGRTHDVAVLHGRLIDAYSRGSWTSDLKIPDHPHCTHVVLPPAAGNL